MAAAQPPATGQRVDPYRAYNFKLIIQGVTEGHFTQCSGMGIEVEAVRYREGGNQQIVRQLPGQVSYGDLTLRYGLTASRDLFDWMMTAVRGQVQRRNISVVSLATDGVAEVVRWNLVDAWPKQWRAAPLDALQTEVAIESLTLVYEALERG